ncbi:DUF2628 domain-containing protein [Lysobacter sp. LF1]|uniref:DUF2628 domain-containing protein n=1 Tax=Lysobacter stagni TaxID=3045172 RepID=A0ABT6XDN0_9GAMM|nr:DUF2628 domain-containing protein [Lysobacter sp. LF1]MDI9238254.1 DUF2628 domain-containing protein [Lysobacter sp. LF1]
MSESWNPYEVAPSSRATQSRPEREHDPIADLDVSETWKRRFRLIEKAGGVQMTHFRDLSFGERMSINFNVLAFFFGPFYYLIKGMWRPAVAYLLIVFAIVVVLELAGLGRLARSVGYGMAAVYSLRANITYYRQRVLEEYPWL